MSLSTSTYASTWRTDELQRKCRELQRRVDELEREARRRDEDRELFLQMLLMWIPTAALLVIAFTK